MILQRFVALSKTIQLFRQNVTSPARSAAVNLNPALRFSDNNNDKDAPATQKLPLERDIEDEERRLKLIRLEISFRRENGKIAPNPEGLNKYQWDELLKLKTKTARKKYYGFLFAKEKKKEDLLIKKQDKKQAFEECKAKGAADENSPFVSLKIDLCCESVQKPLTCGTIRVRAMMFGEKLVFDCSYDPHMTRRDAFNAAKQLTLSFAENRRHKDPFDVHFCNAIPESNTIDYLEKLMPNLRTKGFPLNFHEGSYLDLFPKEKLVYLTPHCNVDLVEYDPEDIYIIGAMVDLSSNQQKFSFHKAKSLGLRIARLPLERYLKWFHGSKSLALNQVTAILLDIKTTGDWTYSLKHVPSRKIVRGDSAIDE